MFHVKHRVRQNRSGKITNAKSFLMLGVAGLIAVIEKRQRQENRSGKKTNAKCGFRRRKSLIPMSARSKMTPLETGLALC
jgi:hypothetical protein